MSEGLILQVKGAVHLNPKMSAIILQFRVLKKKKILSKNDHWFVQVVKNPTNISYFLGDV